MADSTSRRESSSQKAPNFSTPPAVVLKKHRWQLIAASILLAVWVVFLIGMAAYNH